MSRTMRVVLLAFTLLALNGSSPVAAAETAALTEPSASPPTQPRARYFPETRQLVTAQFLEYVQRIGVDVVGEPLTGAYMDKGRLVQWFRNARLEMWGGEPVLSSLGAAHLQGRDAPRASMPTEPSNAIEYFPETGQLVGYALLSYYRAHGGRAVFGLPLTPQVGDVQWFERARLDWDPATSSVRMGELGRELLASTKLPPNAGGAGWIATFREASWRATLDGEDEQTPAWYAMLAVGQERDWLWVWDPIQDRFGYVEAAAVGPIEPPAWHQALGDVTRLNLPARILRTRIDAPQLENLEHNQPITVRVSYTNDAGEQLFLADNGFELTSETVRVPTPPTQTFKGKWIDADLREPVMLTAYEDDRPVYSTLAVKGVGRYPTPTGVHQIWRRVANETMDSETIGIPHDGPGGYLLKNVLFTQYFSSDGAALHYNYWRSDWGYAGSHGCLGMNYADSKWFWDWADVGTTIYLHY